MEEKTRATEAAPIQRKGNDSQRDMQENAYISSESLAEKVAVKGYTITPDALSENTLPIDGLSSKIQEVITQYTDAYQCPREYIVTAIFAAAGVALGKKVSIFDGLFGTILACGS